MASDLMLTQNTSRAFGEWKRSTLECSIKTEPRATVVERRKSKAHGKINAFTSWAPSRSTVLTHTYVVTKHERVARACSCSRCTVQSPRISDQADAQSTDETRSSRTNTACQGATETKSDRGRWGESTLWLRSRAAVCLRLPNEALLIQIRVNDYLIIPILQRAPAPSVLCPVNLQCTNPESGACHETLARPDRSG